MHFFDFSMFFAIFEFFLKIYQNTGQKLGSNTPNALKKMTRCLLLQKMCRQCIPGFRSLVWLEKGGLIFFIKKPIFNPFWPKTPRKHPRNLVKLRHNNLTQKSTVLVAKIPNNFLSLKQNLVILSLSPTQKKLKTEENKVWYQNTMMKNYRD